MIRFCQEILFNSKPKHKSNGTSLAKLNQTCCGCATIPPSLFLSIPQSLASTIVAISIVLVSSISIGTLSRSRIVAIVARTTAVVIVILRRCLRKIKVSYLLLVLDQNNNGTHKNSANHDKGEDNPNINSFRHFSRF